MPAMSCDRSGAAATSSSSPVPAWNKARRWATGKPQPLAWLPGWPKWSCSAGVSGMENDEPSIRKVRWPRQRPIASVSGITAWSHAAPYCATKAAVIQLAKVAAVEYARDNIRVNMVSPGTFRSGIHDGLPEEALDAIAVRHPLGLGQAADIAGAYSYLASETARWTTGSNLVVDGGYSAP